MRQKIVIIICAFLGFTSSLNAQNVEKFHNSKGNYGLKYVNGKEFVKPKYYFISNFVDGIAKARLDGKWSLIDTLGQVIVPFIYDDLQTNTEMYLGRANIFKVKLNGKYGFINNKGEIIIPIVYEYASHFNLKGTVVVGMFTFENSNYKGQYWLIDRQSKQVSPQKYDKIGEYYDVNDNVQITLNNKVGLINNTGKEIFPPQFDKIGNFNEYGIAPTELNGNIGYIDKDGHEISPPKYNLVLDFNADELAEAIFIESNGKNKYGLINRHGKEMIPCLYDSIIYSTASYIEVFKNGKSGIIDLQNKEMIPIKHFMIRYDSTGIILAQYENRKWGLYDSKGKNIVPFNFSDTTYQALSQKDNSGRNVLDYALLAGSDVGKAISDWVYAIKQEEERKREEERIREEERLARQAEYERIQRENAIINARRELGQSIRLSFDYSCKKNSTPYPLDDEIDLKLSRDEICLYLPQVTKCMMVDESHEVRKGGELLHVYKLFPNKYNFELVIIYLNSSFEARGVELIHADSYYSLALCQSAY
ncbi:MAG: WG repeat-containing protein [Chitinophagales bacterium]|nr:WG repeat-containing protein [Chitinophagales bacterium]